MQYKIEEKNDIYFSSLANDINNISQGLENSIEQRIKSERMKSELITNVSHDLKTPLTSIINYVELIKKEIANLLNNKISDEELEKAKKKIKSRFAFAAETVSEIGETIGYYMTVCEDLKLIENYLKDLEDITIDDLGNTIKKYLSINNAVISILEPEPNSVA